MRSTAAELVPEAPTQVLLSLEVAACSVVEAVDLVVAIRLYPSKLRDLLEARLACSPLVVAVLLERPEPPRLLDLPEPTETATEAVAAVEVEVQPWLRLPLASPVVLAVEEAVVAVAVAAA